MAEAQTFPFHLVLACSNGREQQVDDSVVQQVQLVDVEHPPVSFRQQARLEHGAAARQRCRHIDGSDETIFRDAKRDLHKRSGNHRGWWFSTELVPEAAPPFFRPFRIQIASRSNWHRGMGWVKNFNGWE